MPAVAWSKQSEKQCTRLQSKITYTDMHIAQCMCLSTEGCVGVGRVQKEVFNLCAEIGPTLLPDRSVYLLGGT